MSEFLARILGLRTLRLDDPGVRFEFARDWPVWAWFFLIIACAGAAAWSYWRLQGSRHGRAGMGVLRGLFLVLVLVLIAGPQLVRRVEREEKDWVVLLLDRSASMGVRDVERAGSAERVSRDQQLRGILSANAAMIAGLARERNVLIEGFDAGAYDLAPGTSPGTSPGTAGDGSVDPGEPKGRATAIGRALDQVSRRVAGRAVSGIVLISDGKTPDPPSRDTLKQLEARQIPVFAVPLGSADRATDYAVVGVESPSAAFVGDIVPVAVRVERRGPEVEGTLVELVNTDTGEVLDREPLRLDGTSGTARLSAKADAAGAGRWTARIVPPKPDLSPENNAMELGVELVGRAMRVVYFDGYPRWEYRYLKNLLLREKSIRSSAMILSADKKYIQEGSELLDVVPRTPQQWTGIDVVVLGDIRPELFSEEQLRQVRELVSTRGAGLLWIGGMGSTPNAWRGTPLADLVPFTLGAGGDASRGSIDAWPGGVVIRPTPAASQLGVLRLGRDGSWPGDLSDPATGWSQLRWAQRIERRWLKPTAMTLVEAARADAPSTSADAWLPLVATMRFGAGRVVYIGTDEVWRLRYGRGEEYPERFYIPLLRMLARESVGRSGKPATLEVAPSRTPTDAPVQVSVRLLDQSLIERRPSMIRVQVAPAAGGRADELELRPIAPAHEGEVPSVFTAAYIPANPGKFSVASADPLLAGLGLSESLEVLLPDDELRDPQTDHDLLASIAKDTGGRVVAPDEFSSLASLLPNRTRRIPGTPTIETLWDKPIVWALLISLLAGEWIGRRLLRLA